MTMRNRLCRKRLPLLNDASGQGLLEYSILLMLIAMVIVATLQGIGETLDTEYYEPLCSAVTNAGR